MIAARVLGYGKDYNVTVTTPSGEEQTVSVDLTTIDVEEYDWETLESNGNSFEYVLPVSKRKINFKLLTQGTQRKIDSELRGLKKLKKGDSTLTTTLKYTITAVDGDDSSSAIRKFVDNELFAVDSRSLRSYIKKVTPNLDLTMEVIDEETGDPFRSAINIGLDLFWPDLEI